MVEFSAVRFLRCHVTEYCSQLIPLLAGINFGPANFANIQQVAFDTNWRWCGRRCYGGNRADGCYWPCIFATRLQPVAPDRFAWGRCKDMVLIASPDSDRAKATQRRHKVFYFGIEGSWWRNSAWNSVTRTLQMILLSNPLIAGKLTTCREVVMDRWRLTPLTLAGSNYHDRPTLYFNYFLGTEGHVGQWCL